MENIDLKKLSAEQLCDLFNDETAQVKHWDIIQEFIDRKISTVNIQRASGSMNGRPMRIWYNEGRNCIEGSKSLHRYKKTATLRKNGCFFYGFTD